MRRASAFSAVSVLVSLSLTGCPEAPPASSSSTSAGGGGAGNTSRASSGGVDAGPDPSEFAAYPSSCVYRCPAVASCPELKDAYACQNLLPWQQIPHDAACPAWDGSPPAAKVGKCSASAPSSEALKFTGADPDNAKVTILPDGRRLAPAGVDAVFANEQGMTSNLLRIPGSPLVVTVDTGYGAHVLQVVDVTQIGKGFVPLSQVAFFNPEALNDGIAFSAPNRLFVATAQGRVQALSLDVATGVLTRDDARSISLPPSVKGSSGSTDFYVSGVAVSADNTRLFVSGVDDSRLLVLDATAGGATYGSTLGSVELGGKETYAVYVDPHDPGTGLVYIAMWADKALREVDVSDPAAPKVSRSFAVGKNPQGVTFLDARWMLVGDNLGDSLSLVDRVSGAVTPIAVNASPDDRGLEPSSLTYDAASKHVYVTYAGLNAVGVFDVNLAKDPPVLTPAGRLPTQWWPSGVVVTEGGSLVVTSLMSRGTGPRDPSVEYELLHGGIQRIDALSPADLAAGDAAVLANTQVATLPGSPAVSCPPGADDFPIPPTNTGAPSQAIEHVFLVVRENKTYDALLGDLAGGKGNPTGTYAPVAAIDEIWPNIRKVARTFTFSDNFYTSAFISTQGHLWTTHGRTDDYNEREWPVTGYGRSLRSEAESGGVTDVGRPEEGSIFDWLGKNSVPYHVLGEIVGTPRTLPPGDNPIDAHYPGGLVQSIGTPDIEKACYVAGRVRVMCDIKSVVYMTLPNDHTLGVSPSSPTPETMFATNDEATGMLIDAISHSPMWKSSLVIVTEDDPAQGGESVDYHRTILVMASPWLKRGYVSHHHVDISSVHKLVAHLFAIPYPNVQVKNAALPLDMFTSSPDYAPYDYVKRVRPPSCGVGATAPEQQLTASWDLSEIDEQPGLGAQLDRWLHGKQLTSLPPAMEAEIAARIEARRREQARGGEAD